MNKGELIDAIANDAGLSKTQASDALNATLSSISTALKKKKTVTLIGFGSFSVSSRKGRTGRNPATGETIKIKAHKAVKFRPGKTLKELVNK